MSGAPTGYTPRHGGSNGENTCDLRDRCSKTEHGRLLLERLRDATLAQARERRTRALVWATPNGLPVVGRGSGSTQTPGPAHRNEVPLLKRLFGKGGRP